MHNHDWRVSGVVDCKGDDRDSLMYKMYRMYRMYKIVSRVCSRST